MSFFFFPEFKRNRIQIKKKSDQVVRLRKKMRKDSRSVPDPSVQRLVDGCMKELNTQFKHLEDKEKKAMRRIMMEERNRYCTFVACMKPVVTEEMGMLAEIQQIEEVMVKLDKVTTNPNSLPETCEQVISEVRNGDNESLCFATPPSTPSPSIGSRQNSMCSISSLASSRASTITPTANQLTSPSHSTGSQPHGPPMPDTLSLSGSIRLSTISNDSNYYDSRPGSSASQKPAHNNPVSYPQNSLPRPHTISSSYEKGGVRTRASISPSTFVSPTHQEQINSEPVSPVKGKANASLFEQSYSTIKRAYR